MDINSFTNWKFGYIFVKKLIALLLFLSAPCFAGVHVMQGDDVTFSSVTASTGAFTNLIVQNIEGVTIPISSNWTTYAPTFQGLGSPFGVFSYMQMGNLLFISGDFVLGTVTSSEVRISLPPGFVSNANIGTANPQICGIANYVASSTTQYFVAIQPNVTFINFSAADATHNTSVKLLGTDLFNSSNDLMYFAVVPL